MVKVDTILAIEQGKMTFCVARDPTTSLISACQCTDEAEVELLHQVHLQASSTTRAALACKCMLHMPYTFHN